MESYASIQVPTLLAFFSFMLSGSVYTNQIIYRTCYITLGYNKTECALLGNVHNNVTEHLEKLVEPKAAQINMIKSTVESSVSILVCLFIGPWSDRFGRKPILILTLIGFTMSNFGVTLFSYLENLSPWYTLTFSIPYMVTGGAVTYITVLLSYLSDVSTEQTRGIRMAIFEGVLSIASLLGTLLSSPILYATNYVILFLIASATCFLALIYTIFFVPESVQNLETEGKIRNIFQITNMVNMIKASFRKRENYNRCFIFLCLGMLTIYMFIIEGDSTLMFLYLREKFNWTLTKYTYYSSATSVIWIFGTLVSVFFMNTLLKIPEHYMVLVGFVSFLGGSLLQGFARTDLAIYAAAFVRCLGGAISPMVRSLVSKIISKEDIGKIFSLITTSEFLFGMGASPVYTALYNYTIKTNPATYNFLTAGLIGFCILLVLLVIVFKSKNMTVSYGEFQNDEIEYIDDHVIN